MKRLEDVTITSQKEIAHSIFEIKAAGPIVEEMKTPGQFVHIQVDHSIQPLLRRPISLCDVNIAAQELTMIYRAEGIGTQKLSQLAVGETINLLGPLGTGFPLDVIQPGQKAVLVGGGVGVPPLYYLSKKLQEKGVEVFHVNGFASERDAFYTHEFSALGKAEFATVDGTLGTQGFVTDVLARDLEDYDVMYACGPTPMLSALEKSYGHKPLYLSLEQRMGCGIGACLACVCHVPNEGDYVYKKVCTDGPVFAAGEVILI